VLQNRADAPDHAAGFLLITVGDKGFKQRAPVARVIHSEAFLVGRDAPGLLHPQLQLTLVRVKAQCRRRIGAANTAVAHFKPLAPVERVRVSTIRSAAYFFICVLPKKSPAKGPGAMSVVFRGGLLG
jgi:hypothetical protein